MVKNLEGWEPRRIRLLVVARSVAGGGAVRMILAGCRFVTGVFDRFDERKARGRRELLGRRRWLLSWQREARGLWMARLSGPELMDTIERSAFTRCGAITRSTRAMKQILSPRGRAGPDKQGGPPSPP